MPGRQVNLRFTDEQYDLLEAAAFAQGVSMPELIRSTMKGLFEDLKRDPEVNLVRRLRKERSTEEPTPQQDSEYQRPPTGLGPD